MDHLMVLLAPFAVLLPAAGPEDGRQGWAATAAISSERPAELTQPAEFPAIVPEDELLALSASDSFRAPVENQVRIEQRITVRIAPQRPSPRAFAFDGPGPPQWVERKMGNCLPISGIAGVQVGRGNRLTLFMRDRRLVSLGLEKSCRAQDFYSGFYVERSPDGQLCVDRDRLQSRSGANCGLTRLRQLVEH